MKLEAKIRLAQYIIKKYQIDVCDLSIGKFLGISITGTMDSGIGNILNKFEYKIMEESGMFIIELSKDVKLYIL